MRRGTDLVKPVRDCCSIEHKTTAMMTSAAAPKALIMIDASYFHFELPFGIICKTGTLSTVNCA